MSSTSTETTRRTELAAKLEVPPKFFTDDFYAVALFSGIGLLIALIAVACGDQGVWL